MIDCYFLPPLLYSLGTYRRNKIILFVSWFSTAEDPFRICPTQVGNVRVITAILIPRKNAIFETDITIIMQYLVQHIYFHKTHYIVNSLP